MPLKCDEYNGVCVLSINGDLSGDAASAVRLFAEERITEKQVVDFVVDLGKTSFIDSDGLESILWLKRRADDRFGRVKIAAADDNCRKILEITRLAHRFECHSDLATALKTMR
jgi:anti-anti-sigma factor